MDRRTVLQRCGAGLLAGVALAGCSESTAGDGSDDDGNDPTAAETTTVGGSMGSATSTVEGLTITAAETSTTASSFKVLVTIENTGGKTTDLFNYGYELLFFDAEGTDLSTRNPTRGSTEGTEIGPGESTTMNVHAPVNGDPEDVARYEFTLSCEGAFISGVYCES